MSIRHLDRLLEPKSVVVIGASDRVCSVGATVWSNLRSGHFAGPIYPVNPRLATLDGVPVFARPADLPQVPDLAVLCTPPGTIPGLIEELGRLGTRAAIVMTAGLNAPQKQATLDAARPRLLRVLGPNCLGLLSPHLGLNASFAHTGALPGGRSDLKAHGLGRILMHKMIGFLKGRGTQRIVGYVLRENEPMRKLARSLGFEPAAAPAEADADAVFVALKL